MSEPQATSRRSRLWWWVGGIASVIVLALLVAGFVYVRGRGIWTDGMGMVASKSEAPVRDVLWLPPEPMGEQFNTPLQEYEVCVSADGSEMYFVRGLPGKGADLFVSHRRAGQWGDPEPVAPVNTRDDELGPRLSADARTLLFYSNRPGGFGGYDIWASVRQEGRWQPAVNLGSAVNGPHNEYGPALDAQGTRLFFASNRKAAERAGGALKWKATIRQGQIGDYDLFVANCRPSPFSGRASPAARRSDDKSETRPSDDKSDRTDAPDKTDAPERHARGDAPPLNEKQPLNEKRLPFTLDKAVEVAQVNTPHHEGTPCVSPVGDFLYFASNRPGGFGGFDLYRVRITGEDWPEPENLGPQVNTDANETDPQLTAAGFKMYFSSDRDSDQGDYDLFITTSREVYPERQGRDLPQLGWSVWVFLGAVVLLVPLLLFLKAGGYRHLSTIQKCSVVSLLLHVILTLMFSVHELSRQIIKHAKEEVDMEVVVNLSLSNRAAVVDEIRDQISDLPTVDVPQEMVSRSEVDLPPLEEVALPPTEMPQHGAPPASRAMAVVIPRRAEPGKTDVRESSEPTLIPEMPDLLIDFSQQRVSRPESEPKVAPRRPNAASARRATRPEPTAAARVTRAEVVAPKPPMQSAAKMREADRPVARVTPAGPVPEAEFVDAKPDPAPSAIDVAPVRAARSEKAVTADRREPEPAHRRTAETPSAKARTVTADTPRAPAPVRSQVRMPPVRREIAKVSVDVTGLEPEPIYEVPNIIAPGPTARRPVRSEAVEPIAPADRPAVARTRSPAEPTRSEARQVTRQDPRAEPITESAVTAAIGADSPVRSAHREIRVDPPAMPVEPKIELSAEPRHLGVTDESSPSSKADRTIRLISRTDRPVHETGARITRIDTVDSKPPVRSIVRMQDVSRAVPRRTVNEPAPEVALVDVKVDPVAAPVDVPVARADRGEEPMGVRVVPASPTRRRTTTMPAARARTVTARTPAVESPMRSIARNEPAVREVVKSQREFTAPAPGMVDVPLTITRPESSGGPVKATAVGIEVSPARPTMVTRRGTSPMPGKAGQIVRPPGLAKGVVRSGVTGAPGSNRPERSVGAEIAIGTVPAPVSPQPDLSVSIPHTGSVDEAAPPGSVPDGDEVVVTARSAPKLPDARARQVVRLAALSGGAENRPTSLIGLRDSPRPARGVRRARSVDAPELAPAIRPEDMPPRVLLSPRSLAHRTPLERPLLVKKMGGSKRSEEAVERALRYLVSTQQANGRWTTVTDRYVSRKRGAGQSDIALTGLAVLCNLAGGYTPARASDYRKTVARGLDYLVARQGSDGSLLEGGGRMYGHAIATLALAEAATMTGDEKYRKAALKGAEYLLRAQHRSGGGWRYKPGEAGDTSVVGWCVMALHSAERLGMKIPAKTRDGAFRFLNHVGGGRTRVLAGYQSRSPSPAMSAEAGFSRMLLGKQLTDAQQKELGSYLLREGQQKNNYYCWYYTSLALFQLGGKPWEQWNPTMRDHLIKLQRRGGKDDGSWPGYGKFASHNGAGKVYTTSMATLTLEVYYRYLPMFGGKAGQVGKP